MRKPPNLSEAAKAHKRQVTADWQKENTQIMPVRVPVQKFKEYTEYAARKGETRTGLIVRLLEAEMERNP